MRTIGKTVAALVLATGSIAGALSIAGPSMAGGGSLIGPVDIVVEDNANDNEIVIAREISVLRAATICSVNVDVLTAALINQEQASCPGKSNSHQKAWVRKSHK